MDVARLMGDGGVEGNVRGMRGQRELEGLGGRKRLIKSRGLEDWGDDVLGVHVNMIGTTEGGKNEHQAISIRA